MSAATVPPATLQADSAGCALMGLAGGIVSAESADYVENKTQFQLHTMLTEQRHKNTMNMSQTITKDAAVRKEEEELGWRRRRRKAEGGRPGRAGWRGTASPVGPGLKPVSPCLTD